MIMISITCKHYYFPLHLFFSFFILSMLCFFPKDTIAKNITNRAQEWEKAIVQSLFTLKNTSVGKQPVNFEWD